MKNVPSKCALIINPKTAAYVIVDLHFLDTVKTIQYNTIEMFIKVLLIDYVTWDMKCSTPVLPS